MMELITPALTMMAQGMAGITIARVNNRDTQAALPAEPFLLQRAFETGDPCCADVLLNKVGIGHNRVANIGAIQRGFQATGLT